MKKKNNKVKILSKVLIALVLTTSSIYAFAPWQFALYYFKPLPATVEEELALATNNGIDGIIVYIQQGDKPGKTFASGWHNKAEGIPALPEALFKIASIAKLYDAVAVAKLSADGKVNLDSSLASYLPELRGRIENADSITLRMMVQHRSGIPNFTDQDGFDWAKNDLDIDKLIFDKPADFAPGTDYAYSNTNYLLLQRVMTRVLGYSYFTYIQDNILQPLKLNDTYESVNHINRERLMSGYYVGSTHDFKFLDQGMIATAQNVGIFIKALNDGSLLTEEEMQIYQNLYEFEHTGWVLGYSSIARYNRENDKVVVQFTNTTGNDTVLLTQIIYNRIFKITN